MLSQVAHRLKASWSLFAMHNATRSCQAIEILPEMLAAGVIPPDALPSLTSRFCARMEANLQQLDAALKELSDKY
jgi:two-component system sensor histidine kinase EvgS